ncbi:MAG TPA: UDP-N-acetylglucosamine 2-epimerase (non-hydrolyzing) [Verrucomicrobiae bacterium]|nr:UDP-N-acetylglucosamine 2-epimerase (non-hydrolyzing) [Verrucomicrobiae bacterium]
MDLAIVVGTRPEIIKMSPVIKACEAQGVGYTLIDTKQHYSDNMSSAFYDDLELRPPDHVLATKTGSHGTQLGSMLPQLEEILQNKPHTTVIVQGDTNTVLAGALTASRQGVAVAHVEAGLRSRDRTMPEEINRILVDNIAKYLFAPSNETVDNLRQEGIAETAVWNVGNTIVDATLDGIELAKKKSATDTKPKSDYLLLTLHRPANVDDPVVLKEILAGVAAVMKAYQLPALFPVHPRTRQRIASFGLALPKDLQLIDPVGYLDFLMLESGASLILTDSGGIQEEACIMHVPCVTLRNNTERPETIMVGANILGGTEQQGIRQAADVMLGLPTSWGIPYGDGKTGERILNILTEASEPYTTNNATTVGARGLYETAK